MNTVLAIIAHRFSAYSRLRIFLILLFVFSIGNGQGQDLASSGNSYYRGMLFSNTPTIVDSLQSEELMLEGLKEKISGNLLLASDYFKQSLQADPHNDASSYELAQIQIGKKDFAKAKEYIDKSLEVKPTEVFYLRLLVEIYTGLHDMSGVLTTFDRLIAKEPYKQDYYLGKGDALVFLGKNEEAIKLYNHYENISHDYEFAELQKQKIYLAINQNQEALSSTLILLDKFPNTTRYYLLISEIYRSLGRKQDAWKSLMHAQNLAPDDGFVRLGIFEYYASGEEIKKADSALAKTFETDDISVEQKVKILEDYFLKRNLGSQEMGKKLSGLLLQDYPDNNSVISLHQEILTKSLNGQNLDRKLLADYLFKQGGGFKSWNNLMEADLKAGDYESLVIHTDKALELYPNQASLYYYKGIALKQLKNIEKSIQTFKLGLTMAEGNSNSESVFLGELGEIYESMGKYKLADSAFRASLKRNQNPRVMNNFAYYLSLRSTDLVEADSLALKANVLEKDNSNLEDTYSWILYKEKQYAKALIWIEKAIIKNPSGAPTFWDHYGDILYANGNIEKAVEAWKKAFSFGSKNVLLKQKIINKKP